jgi:hypothetical protein
MALATSKRKFYKLLDNLSSSKVQSQNQAATLNNEPQTIDRPSKRSRMPRSAQQHSVDGSRPSSTSIRVLSPGSTTTTTRIATSHGLEEISTYAPWSQDQFLGRLETFADVKIWTTKPEPLSDVYWARRGWIVVERDGVACRTCGKHMLVKIGADESEKVDEVSNEVAVDQEWWQADMEQDFVNRYEKLIIDGHTQDCLWRKAGCKGKYLVTVSL